VPFLATIPRASANLVLSPSSLWCLAGALAVAATGVSLGKVGFIARIIAVACCLPVVQLGIVHAAYRCFVRVKHRAPVDVYYNMRSGLAFDRLYSFVVFIGGFVPGMLALVLWGRAT